MDFAEDGGVEITECLDDEESGSDEDKDRHSGKIC